MTAETAVTPDTGEEIAEILQATTRRLTLSGIECEVNRLKTREFFALLRVLTKGIGPGVATLFETSGVDDAGRMMAMLMMAVPEAEDDFIVFVRRIVRPLDTTKETVDAFMEAVANPELDELLEIVEIIVEQEASEFRRLGNAARSWWETMGPKIRTQAAQ